ncbi:MAG: hypothetical protein LC772_08030 [Chloroflexi bacterium]|nr:hypothetical protein [Chloroflexota bacterium]
MNTNDEPATRSWLGFNLGLGVLLAVSLLEGGAFNEHPANLGSLLFWIGPPVLGAIAGWKRPSHPWRWVVAQVCPIPIAEFARILHDRLADRNTHLLWPVEILLITLIAAVIALIGAYTAAAIQRRRRHSR